MIAVADVAMFAASVILIWFGSKARYCYPICECGYDVSAAPADSALCSECGTLISQDRVTIASNAWVNLGIVLLILSILGAVFVVLMNQITM